MKTKRPSYCQIKNGPCDYDKASDYCVLRQCNDARAIENVIREPAHEGDRYDCWPYNPPGNWIPDK